MPTRARVPISLLLTMTSSLLAADPAPNGNTDANTPVAYLDIGAGLPWVFEVSTSRLEIGPGQTEPPWRYGYVSRSPLRDALYLRVELLVAAYPDDAQAAAALEDKRAQAHPDMGLSYAWDYLLAQGARLYHLHAGCELSEANFDRMAANLRIALKDAADPLLGALRCRCGGGCAAAEDGP